VDADVVVPGNFLNYMGLSAYIDVVRAALGAVARGPHEEAVT
jgi:hypothetical protein